MVAVALLPPSVASALFLERGVRYFISADCFRVERGASAHMAIAEKSRARR